jgi:SAM-dependent methyltransferase
MPRPHHHNLQYFPGFHQKETEMADKVQPTEIHEAVQTRYGKIVKSFDAASQASCCGSSDELDDCGCSSDLYDVSLLEGLPTDVTGLSLGCGDPITLAALETGQTVLDLGSGGGIDVFMAARQVGPQGHVIGVDMTDEMLAKAESNKAKLGEVAQNTEFRKGFIEELPVEDDTVDVVISNCVINLSPDKPQVFRESFRVLKPGGRLAVSDIVIEGEFSEEARANMNSWAACVSGAQSVDDYLGAIRDAGFIDVEITDKDTVGANVIDFEGEGAIAISKRIEGSMGPRVYSARVTARKPGAA